MISVKIETAKQIQESKRPIGLFWFEDKGAAAGAWLGNKERKALADRAKEEFFSGKAGEIATFTASDGAQDRRFWIIGLGKKKDANTETLRKGAAAMYRATKKRYSDELAIDASPNPQVIAEGLLLASYSFCEYKAPCKDTKSKEVSLLAAKAADRRKLEAAAAKATAYAHAVCTTRDLVNQGPSDKSPETLAKYAKQLTGKQVTLKVIDKKEAEKRSMGGLLGVGRGSAKPPLMLHLAYKPKKKTKRRIVLVGKGVTFDSGGLSLKPPGGMETMKCDMAGAATVLGVFRVLADLGVKAEVHGITPLTYNMPGPDAVKPGDILKASNGKTIEVLNTDAEGRLILADALVYAAKLKPDLIMDFATLTGAAVIALGRAVTAAMTNNKAALQKLLASSKKADEFVWELPLVKQYRQDIRSNVADIQNIGKPRGEAGTITAGLFLQEFVEEKQPWIHFDIAGPAFSAGGNGYCPPGGTGVMVRSVLEYLTSL